MFFRKHNTFSSNIQCSRIISYFLCKLICCHLNCRAAKKKRRLIALAKVEKAETKLAEMENKKQIQVAGNEGQVRCGK